LAATDRLEDCIITVRRLFRYFEKVKSDQSGFPLDRLLKRRIEAVEQSIRETRNLIEHLDSDISSGKVQRGQSTAPGSPIAAPISCRFPISTSSSPCRRRPPRSPSRTRPSSTTSCSRRRPRRFASSAPNKPTQTLFLQQTQSAANRSGGANSLLSGKFTGNFTKIGPFGENLPARTQQNQSVAE
jgi:hypothetical protein